MTAWAVLKACPGSQWFSGFQIAKVQSRFQVGAALVPALYRREAGQVPDRVVAIASVAPAALAGYSPAALLCRSLAEAKTQWV